MDKRALSETDICDQFITPAVANAGWGRDDTTHVRRELSFTKGPYHRARTTHRAW